MGRNSPFQVLMLVVLSGSIMAAADDALRDVPRPEALEQSSHLVAAHNTGKRGSMRERQKEGYWCSFSYEEWVLDSVVRGASPWKVGARIRAFHAGQDQDCWRANEYRTRGIDIGLMLPVYVSETKLPNSYEPGARGILLGRLRGTRDFELAVGGSIESPDQAGPLGREWDGLHQDAASDR